MKRLISYQAAFVAALGLSVVVGEPFQMVSFTIDGGGVMRSTSKDGVFVLLGTIGQPDAGAMSGGDFKLAGGFWFETPPGDCNVSGSLDLLDHGAFAECLFGPDVSADETCICFDVDGSGTVDLGDLAEVQRDFLGG